MPTRPLPHDPSFEHLRKEAKQLRKARGIPLAQAQFETAQAYGFSSWTKLKAHLKEIEPFIWNPPPHPDISTPEEVFIRQACLVYGQWHPSFAARARQTLNDNPHIVHNNVYAAAAAGDVDAVGALLDREPALVNKKGGPLQWEPLLYASYSRLEPGAATLAVARLLLSRGADPNAGYLDSGSYAFTALTGAFGRGEDWPNQPPHPEWKQLATLLLDAGADPNDGQTLYNRHFQADDDHLKLLMAYGLGRDTRGPWLKRLNDTETTPATMLVGELCAAAQHNFLERVKLLVEHGVDVNARGQRNRRTPYEEALREGHHEVAEYLVSRGAQRIELDALETFALDCIAGRREKVLDRLQIDPTILERLGHAGRTELLHRAVDAKQRDAIRLIVDLGIDINAMVPGTGWDRAVLHNAAGWAGLDMVKFLLDLGADPTLRDLTFHSTPIGWAFHNHQRDVVEYLMASADVFDALRCDGVERVGELLQQDPSLANARDERGTHLVFYLHAELTRVRELLAVLTASGADINARDTDGRTLLDHAVARGLSDIVDTLRRFGARTSTSVSDGS